MLEELINVYPQTTVYESLNTFLAAQASAAQEKIDDFRNGVSGVALPYLNGVIRAEDFKQALDSNELSINTEVHMYLQDGSIQDVPLADVVSSIGDSVIASESLRTAISLINDKTDTASMLDSTNLRSNIQSRFGHISANATSYLDTIGGVLDTSGTKLQKLRALLNLHNTKYIAGTGFVQPVEQYTGVNPWVALFSGPWPDFQNVGQYMTDIAVWIGKTNSKIRKWHVNLVSKWFSDIKNWFSIQANPFDLTPQANFDDYSLNTGFIKVHFSFDDYIGNADFNKLQTYIYSHGNKILCIPTLGATWYIKLDGDYNEPDLFGLEFYIKKHVYNYSSANALRRVASLQYTGPDDDVVNEFLSKMNAIGDLAPVINEQSTDLENDLFNGLIQAEALIPLGIQLLSGDTASISRTLDAYNDGTIDSMIGYFKSNSYSYSTYYSNPVSNLDWLNEYQYQSSYLINYILNTVIPIINDVIVDNNQTEGFAPYLWLDGQLQGFAVINSDAMNSAQLNETLKTIAISGIIVATAALAITGIAKLKLAAFSATRTAEQAIYNSDLSDVACKRLANKANFLSALAGMGTNAVVDSSLSFKNAYSDIKNLKGSTTDITLSDINDEINDVKDLIR